MGGKSVFHTMFDAVHSERMNTKVLGVISWSRPVWMRSECGWTTYYTAHYSSTSAGIAAWTLQCFIGHAYAFLELAPKNMVSSSMNRIQRNKLLLSKWTAVEPKNKEKHFVVTRLVEAENEPLHVIIEAVHSKREQTIIWSDLKDASTWRQGWK